MAADGRVYFVLLLAGMACQAEVPRVKLNDGREMPSISLGSAPDFEKGEFVPLTSAFTVLVEKAIEAGWRNLDTATFYESEKIIGDAIKAKLDEGAVKREDLFVSTKLWNTHHEKEKVQVAIRESLKELQLDFIDMYLMHWPLGLNEDYEPNDVDFMETWQGMEEVQRLGLAKSIGVCNFNQTQLTRLLKEATVKPAVLQIEIHPQSVQKELVEYAQSQGVVVMGYSPLGSMVTRFGMDHKGPKFTDEIFTRLSKKYKKTPVQVALRYVLDRNIVPVVKATFPDHVVENINVFDFSLTRDEVAEFNAFEDSTRYNLPSFWQDHPYYPLHKIANPIPNPFKPKKNKQ